MGSLITVVLAVSKGCGSRDLYVYLVTVVL